MAKTAPNIQMREARKLAGSDSFIQNLPDAGGSAFVAGQLVAMISGYVNIAAAGDLNIIGIALQDCGSGSAGANSVPVLMLDAHSEVLVNMKTSNGGAGSDFVLLATNVGLAYDVTIASGKFYLDNATTSNPKFRVVAIHPDYAVGDTNAWVYAAPIQSTLHHGGENV